MTPMWFALICHRDLGLKNDRDPNPTRIGFATSEIVWHGNLRGRRNLIEEGFCSCTSHKS